MSNRPPARWNRRLEELELRRCLSVNISLVEGDLHLSQDTGGPIAIIRTADGGMQILEIGDGNIPPRETLSPESVDTLVVVLGDAQSGPFPPE